MVTYQRLVLVVLEKRVPDTRSNISCPNFWLFSELLRSIFTQPTASLIINEGVQFLLLLEHWFYELIGTTTHPWFLCVLFLEKPLGLTLLARALVSMETNPPILHLLRPRLMTLVSLIAELVKNLPAMQETQVWFLGWEDPLEKEWPSTPVFWPEEFHGLDSPWGSQRVGRDWAEQLWLHLWPSK